MISVYDIGHVMRTLIDLPDDDIAWLDQVARKEGKSRAAIVREAIVRFRLQEQRAEMTSYFGLWARHGSDVDGLAFERALRDEWPSGDALEDDARPQAA